MHRSRSSIWRHLALVFTAVALAGCGGSISTPAIDDELPAEQDNGPQGLDPFGNEAHIAPVAACNDALRASDQSLVIRVLPRGPLAPDGSLAFTSGVCVYLPPGYLTSNLRYPVLYLLHGGGGDQADWVTYGGIRAIMDSLIAADAENAAVVVMPDGRDGQWYDSFDGSIKNEQYVLDYLIPYVDRHFRTIAERNGRVIDGLSNGGYGAMLFAAKAPDRFVAAGGMSSNLAAVSIRGLGTASKAPAYRHGNLPVDLTGNLDGVDLTLDIGTVCITDQAIDDCVTFRFEQVFVPANREFRDQLASRAPSDGVFDYRETEGGHSWRWWPLWLRERHLPFFLARLADPRSAGIRPASAAARPGFRYRTIAQQFSVWGYEVHVERVVREFLDFSDVRASGLVVQGSGRVTIRTASLYKPRHSYTVANAGDSDSHVVADAAGQITFTVDLGPSHEHEQYSSQANALEADGGYWTVRDIEIREGG
jgi:enterochelin esterase-like enzyme